MNKQQKHDFEVLRELGMSERTAWCLVRLAGMFNPEAYETKQKAGYITADGDFPLNFQNALEYLGMSPLRPWVVRDVLEKCPYFAKEFKIHADSLGIADDDIIYSLVTFYTRWVNLDNPQVAYAPVDCKDYSSEEGWHMSGSFGLLMLYKHPAYTFGVPGDRKDTSIFQAPIEPLNELFRYVGVYACFNPGSKLGAVAGLLGGELAHENRIFRDEHRVRK